MGPCTPVEDCRWSGTSGRRAGTISVRDDRRVPGVRGHGEGAPPRAAAGQDRARATAVRARAGPRHRLRCAAGRRLPCGLPAMPDVAVGEDPHRTPADPRRARRRRLRRTRGPHPRCFNLAHHQVVGAAGPGGEHQAGRRRRSPGRGRGHGRRGRLRPPERRARYWTMGPLLPADLVDNLHTAVRRPSSAAARHAHPEPDTGLFEGMLPYVPGWEINYGVAAKTGSACWAGCESCQEALPPRLSPTGPPSPVRSSSCTRPRPCSACPWPVPLPGHGSSRRTARLSPAAPRPRCAPVQR